MKRREDARKGISGKAPVFSSPAEHAILNPHFAFKLSKTMKETMKPPGQHPGDPGAAGDLGSRFCLRVAFLAGKPGSCPFAPQRTCCQGLPPGAAGPRHSR